MSGSSTPRRVQTRGRVRTVDEAWSREAISGPLAGDGIVLAMDGTSRTVAFQVATGEVLWTYPLRGQPTLVADGHVFVGVDHEVHLVDLRTGQPRGCLPGLAPMAAASPERYLLLQARLFAHAHDRLSCLDRASGRRLWAYDFPSGPRTAAAWAAARGKLLVGRHDGVLACLDLASGAEVWRHSWPEWGWHDGRRHHPVEIERVFTHADLVIAAVGPHVVALDGGSGRPRWHATGKAEQLVGGRLYAAEDGWYVVRDARTGRSLRRARLVVPGLKDDGRPPEHSLTLVAGDSAYLAARDGIAALDRTSGRCSWVHSAAFSEVRCDVTLLAGGRVLHRAGRRLVCLAPSSAPGPAGRGPIRGRRRGRSVSG